MAIQIGAPDGTTIEFPEGTSDETIKSVMAREYGAPKKAPEGKGVLGYVDDAVRALANGATFGLADRLAAGAGALTGVGGKFGDYSGNLTNEQDRTAQFREEHPIVAPVIEGVGGVAAPVGVLGAAAKGASLGAKALYGAGVGAGFGGVQGFGSSRDWTNLPQTAKDTAIGVGTGAVLGGALPMVAGGVGGAYNAIMGPLRGRAEGMSREASRHLVDALQADDPDIVNRATNSALANSILQRVHPGVGQTSVTVNGASASSGAPASIGGIQQRLAELGPDAMLADTGPAMLGKAQGASLNSDEGRSILSNALKVRDKGTNSRIMSDVNAALGPAEDPQTVTNAIRAHRTNVDNAAYPAALDNAPDVQVAHIITQLDDMIPRSVGDEQKALRNLRSMMMTTERRPRLNEMGHQEVNPNTGQPIFDTVPVSQNNAEVLHKIKGELDKVIEYDAPGLGVPSGALSRQQGALKNLRGQLNEALEGQVPGYAAANRQSAALAQRGAAVEKGTQYLGSGKTTPSPERFAAEFEPLSQGEKIAFAKGSRGEIERILGTKANDLQALRGELQGEGGWNTAKLATVHGQGAADQLTSSVDRNLKFRDTYNKVVENSQTAQRTAAQKAMKPDPSSETPLVNPNMSVTGLLATGAKKAAVGAANALLRKDPTASYGEIARVLTAQGAQRDRHLLALSEALNRRQSVAASAPAVGNRAALAAGLLGQGFAHQSPERRNKSR